MALAPVAVANSHHPQMLYFCKVLIDNERILISLLLSWDEPLPRFDGVDFNWIPLLLDLRSGSNRVVLVLSSSLRRQRRCLKLLRS